MMRTIRHCLLATAVTVALGVILGGPAGAQTTQDPEGRYAGVPVPAVGSRLAGPETAGGPGIAPVGSTPAVGGAIAPVGGSTPGGAVLGTSGPRPAVLQNQVPLQVTSGGTGSAPQARAQGLALTGTDVMSLVIVALGAMTAGAVLVRRTRQRPSTTP